MLEGMELFPKFSPDGKRLLSVAQDQIILWNVATGTPTLTVSPSTSRHFPVNATSPNGPVAFSPDGTALGISDWGGALRFYATATHEEVTAGGPHPEVFSETHLGSDWQDREAWEEAIECYTRAIHDDPNDQRAWRGRAQCYVETGQLDLAYQDYERVVDLLRTFGGEPYSGDLLPTFGGEPYSREVSYELSRVGQRWDELERPERALAVRRLQLEMLEPACEDVIHWQTFLPNPPSTAGDLILTSTARIHLDVQ